MKQFDEEVKKHKEEVKKNVHALLAELPAVHTKFTEIVDNENQTHAEMRQKIEELRKEKPKVHHPIFFDFFHLQCIE